MIANGSRFLTTHAFVVARLAVFLVVAGMFAAILAMNGGKLTYSLDDPYLHLSVSEQIWHGGYGINTGEFASPSSSILFPFLLTVGAFNATVHQYVPFVVDLVSLFLTMEILRRLMARVGLGRSGAPAAVAALLIGLSALCLNMICLVFTGMEQNLHIALTAAAVLGLVVFLEEGRLAWWFVASVALLPTIRYEGAGLCLGILVCLACRSQWRAVLGIGAFVVATVGGFSLFLIEHDLPFLPGSVLAKSGPMSRIADEHGGGLLSGLQEAISQNLSSSAGLIAGAFAVIAAAFLSTGWRRRPYGNDTLMAFVLLAFAAGQIVFGQNGWWGRYEIYELVGGSMMTLYLLRAPIAAALADPERRARFAAGGAAALLVVGFPYIRLTALSPVSANNIYEQQYQMHRFIVDHVKQPVAVADLGFTSYRNDNYVFDLLGLGSEEARTAKPKSDLTSIDRFIQARGIKFVIFYQNWWLVNKPADWQCVGAIHLSRHKGSPARATMDFCVTRPQYADELRRLLAEFRPDLPPRIRLDILPEK
jgi:hypothetical protein